MNIRDKELTQIGCLSDKDTCAVGEFRKRIAEKFPEARFVLFGSKVHGKDEEFSDIDILIVLKRKITTSIEKNIFDIGFDVGLELEVVFGIVVEEDKFWNSRLAKEMPFYQNVAKKGVVI